jgi:ATP-binding cassette subfamily B protein/ATP-binding cassette subfamily C protein
LFSHSLRENILLGLQKSDKEIVQAMETAVFDQDVATMPEGLETLVGVKGVRLSGGQLQRAAATRMLVRQPELLIFDDLSSALDVETEQKLWERLLTKRSAKVAWTPTCLVVSHRPYLLHHADQVIVLRDGQVQAQS